MATNPAPYPPSLVERAKAIILSPGRTWQVIDAEPATVADLYKNYALILAAIAPIAMLIGGQVFGFGAFGVTYRPPIMGSLTMALSQYAMTLIGLALLAVIINALAPRFGGQRNQLQAFKVAVYSATPGMIAGIFGLLPSLSMLSILGVYGFYLLYLGLPALMKAPAEKALGYTAVVVLVGAALMIVATTVMSAVSGPRFASPAVSTRGGSLSGAVAIPGVGSVDIGKLEAAGQRLQKSAERAEQAMAEGKRTALEPAQLQAMLPESLGRFQRVEVSSAGMAMGAQATAKYQEGDHNLTLEIVDVAVVGSVAGLGAALGVESNRQTATGYDKTETIDGRLVQESWNSESSMGEYSTTIADRFMVKARGNVQNIDELRAATQVLIRELAKVDE